MGKKKTSEWRPLFLLFWEVRNAPVSVLHLFVWSFLFGSVRVCSGCHFRRNESAMRRKCLRGWFFAVCAFRSPPFFLCAFHFPPSYPFLKKPVTRFGPRNFCFSACRIYSLRAPNEHAHSRGWGSERANSRATKWLSRMFHRGTVTKIGSLE